MSASATKRAGELQSYRSKLQGEPHHHQQIGRHVKACTAGFGANLSEDQCSTAGSCQELPFIDNRSKRSFWPAISTG
jgi:hypothetical protein